MDNQVGPENLTYLSHNLETFVCQCLSCVFGSSKFCLSDCSLARLDKDGKVRGRMFSNLEGRNMCTILGKRAHDFLFTPQLSLRSR